MTTKKGLSLKLAIVGIDEWEAALDIVNEKFQVLKEAAIDFQNAVNELDGKEIQVIRE